MIRRNHRSLLRFGAVATALLLALPALAALADEIEPEPDVEEAAVQPEPEPAAETEARESGGAEAAKQPDRNLIKIFDLLIMRPVGLVTTVVGGVFFVPAALLAAPSGPQNIRAAWEQFVAPSVERTFFAPLGEL